MGKNAQDRSLLVRYLKEKFSATVSALPEQEVTDRLVDIFFNEANSHVGVLSRYFFHKAESAWRAHSDELAKTFKLEGLSRDVLYFPAVLFQVLAVALQYVTLDSEMTKVLALTTYAEIDELSQRMTELGMELMKLLGRHSPTVMSVQHDLMRAFWLKNCSCGTESWYILGDATRQAQDLGLHLQSDVPDSDNVSETLEALWYAEWKKRLWVSLFNWDAHMALVLGRPRSINAADCTVDPPLDCIMPASPPTTVPTNAVLSKKPSDYTRHLHHNFIAHKTHEMLSLGANRRYVKDYGVVKRLQDDILRGLEELPPTHRPNNTDTSWDTICPYLPRDREVILNSAYSFLVALHRPHAVVKEESRQAAVLYALATLEAQERLFNMLPTSHYRTFGIAFYTIDSGLFLSTTVLDRSLGDDLMTKIHMALFQAIRRLNMIKARSPMADSGVRVLEACYEKIQKKYPKVNCKFSYQLPITPQETPSLLSGSTTLSSDISPNTIQGETPDYTDFDWAFPANGADSSADFDLLGNFTDFNASFWTDQMSSILDSNADHGETDNLWQFLVT